MTGPRSGSTHSVGTADTPDIERYARLRESVADIRNSGQQMLREGAAAGTVAAELCRKANSLVVRLFLERVTNCMPGRQQRLESQLALVAVGGSGRGEVAPWSDVDLLLLFESGAWRSADELIGPFVRDCWDAGLQLGHSVRNIAETIHAARDDAEIATGIVDARLLWGSDGVFNRLRQRFHRKVVATRRKAFIDGCLAARGAERARHGGAVFQLEPDVKRSSGGLRDIHLIRWLGYARYGAAEPAALARQKRLSRRDLADLNAAHEFLTGIRLDMHYASGRSQDHLSRDEQLRISAERDISPLPGQRPVEQLMQQYFRHTAAVADISDRFTARIRPRTWSSRLTRLVTTHRSGSHFLVAGRTLDVHARERDTLCRSLPDVCRVYRAAARYQVSLAPGLVETIRSRLPQTGHEMTQDVCSAFLEILETTGGLGDVLRSMLSTGTLDLLVPAVTRARGLLQFNQYHSYTVDEHTIRAIEACVELETADTAAGEAYRAVGDRAILHLALLLHDLGKGFDEDHSDVGRRIAEETADRLGLDEERRETLVFLVHRHLSMSHRAFRRDLDDPATILEFSREVLSPERLRMLYVLTAADITAVGPDVLTDWKAELLTSLFNRTLLCIEGTDYRFHQAERIAGIRNDVLAAIRSGREAQPVQVEPTSPAAADSPTEVARTATETTETAAAETTATVASIAVTAPAQTDADAEYDAWALERLALFPPHYLIGTSPSRIARDLATLRLLGEQGIRVNGRLLPQQGMVEFRIIAREEQVQGCFHRVAGALTARRLEIRDAQISTSGDGIIVDRFRVFDGDYEGAPPPERLRQIKQTILSVLDGTATVEELFQHNRRYGQSEVGESVSNLPLQVAVDSTTSTDCTILDVFAHDRPGLLYTVSASLFRQKLSVRLAKISTHFDQVVDVFYVTDADGEKITDTGRLREIRSTLLEEICEFENSGWQRFGG